MNLPDIFTFFDGSKAENQETWAKRREELKAWFTQNVYGVFPENADKGFSYEVIKDETNARARIKTVNATKNGVTAYFKLYLPKTKKKPPVIVYPVLRAYEDWNETDVDDFVDEPSKSALPIGRILDRGYALATYKVTAVAPDDCGGEDQGFCKALIENKTPSSARVIAAWSFFAKRIADFLEKDNSVDMDRLGIAGHSRGGKTALLTAATDERFKFVYVNNSGCTGAAIARGNTGESITQINKGFPHWFTDVYKAFNDREECMPVDFHELTALVAPRLLYVTSSSDDAWACPENEFESARLAGEVYKRIYGIDGLIADEKPTLDKAYHDGNVAYHIKTGIHSFDCSDWAKCLDFLDKKGWNK